MSSDRGGKPQVRGRGRPRSPDVDRALLEAATAEFVSRGYRGMSMESLASRAGVSKVSLYRRWKSKREVVADVLASMGEGAPTADKGGLEADLRYLVRRTLRSPKAKENARMIMRTVGEIADDPRLSALYRERLLAPRLEQVRALVERARARGELRDELSVEIAASMVGGPLFLYSLAVLAGADRSLPAGFEEDLVRTMLDGIRKAV